MEVVDNITMLNSDVCGKDFSKTIINLYRLEVTLYFTARLMGTEVWGYFETEICRALPLSYVHHEWVHGRNRTYNHVLIEK